MSKQSNGDRWSRGFNKAVNSITHAPKNKIRATKQVIHEEMIPLEHDIDELAENIEEGAKNTYNTIKNTPANIKRGVSDKVQHAKDNASKVANTINAVKNAKGVGGKLGALGNAAAGTETVKKIAQAISAAVDAAKWVIANIEPIGITAAVVFILGNLTIFIIGVLQGVTPTPHYYCDTNANSSIKKTAVYQQYCSDYSGFELENLNGHYIVQDGSGPCAASAMNNMFMRYYTEAGINYFDYLWCEDGKYKPAGQTLSSNKVSTSGTIRKLINGGSPSRTNTRDYHCNTSLANGSYKFAQDRGMYLYMANWGYLRDPSFDIASYEQTSDYYVNNSSSDKWVWDLSVANIASGSTWGVLWDYTLTIDNVPCIAASASGSNLTGDTIKSILSGLNGEMGEAGVVMYYQYPKQSGGFGNHAILITDYDSSSGYWRVIDAAKGINGGYEGPLDGSGHFCIHDSQINALLNSGNNEHNSFKILTISYCSTSFF